MTVSAGNTDRTNLLAENGNLVAALVANPDLLKTVLNEIYDYLDANWNDYNTHKTNAVLGHPDGSVTTAKIANSGVTTIKLADGNVTTAKIADQSVTINKLDPTIQNSTNLEVVNARVGLNQTYDTLTSRLNDEIGFLSKRIRQVSVLEYGAKGDGVTDDTTAIQAAIDYINSVGGGTVFFPKGTYDISATLTVYPYVEIFGEGRTSIIQSDNDIDFFTTPGVLDVYYSGIRFRNIKLKSAQTTDYTKYQINLINTEYAMIENVEIQTLSTVDQSKGGIKLSSNKTGALASYMTHIDKCWLRGSQIDVGQTDCKITNSWIWGIKKEYSVKVSAANCTISACDFIGNGYKGAIYVTSSVKGCRVVGCFFDGSYNTTITSYGILTQGAEGLIVTGSYFWNHEKAAIRLEDSLYCSISANVFIDNNRDDAGHSDIELVGVTRTCIRNTVQGNTHRMFASRANKGYAVVEINAGFDAFANLINGNTIEGSNYATPNISVNRTASTPSLIRGNQGSNLKLVANGEATIPAGASSVVIVHGLNVAPKAHEIRIVPTNSLANAKVVYLDPSSILQTQFTVRSDVAIEASNSAKFYWSVEIQ